MLREIPNVRQISGEPKRRWFTDDKMDLFVWVGELDDVFSGFELSYDKSVAERTIRFRQQEGFRHLRVDDGSRSGKHPGTPILVADGEFDGDRVLNEFLSRAREIDEGVLEFVQGQLTDFPKAKAESVESGFKKSTSIWQRIRSWFSR